MSAPRTFVEFGFPDPTPQFVRVTTVEDSSGRALIQGVVVIPGLPVCRVQVTAEAERIFRFGSGRPALLHYVRTALHEDVAAELPWN